MVRGHERNTKNGVSFVKFHFRGERHFTWAGYKVDITVPGKDHFMLPEINVGSSDEYWHHDENERWIEPARVWQETCQLDETRSRCEMSWAK